MKYFRILTPLEKIYPDRNRSSLMGFTIYLLLLIIYTPAMFADENIIAPGITYEKRGDMHVIFCNIGADGVSVRPAIAGCTISDSLENVLDITSRENAVVGINANYFGHRFNSSPIGEIKGILVIDGELISTISTINPWLNAGIGITKDRRVVAGRPVNYEITISTDKERKYRNILVNPLEWEGYDYVMIYTSNAGLRVPSVEAPYIVIHPLKGRGLTAGEKSVFKVARIEEELPVISGDACVLTGTGEGSKYLRENFKQGDEVSIDIEFDGVFRDIWQMVGGRLRMVLDGRNRLTQDHPNDILEEKMSAGRIDDKTLVLCCGTTTCYEMAEFLVKLGVTDAILLDGGGSANMVVRGENIYGGDRKIADALLIYSKEIDYENNN